VRASAKTALQRGIAARPAAPVAQFIELRAGTAIELPSSAVRLAMQMSRHISGWLAAMRVKVAEAAGGEAEEQVAVLALRQVVHQGEGQQVRQVADRGEHPVVLARRISCTVAPQASQAARTRSTPPHRVLRQRRQHHFPVAIEIGRAPRPRRCSRRRQSDAPARTARDALAKALRATARRRRLGAAAIGDNVPARDKGAIACHQRRHLADRRGEQDQIGIRQGPAIAGADAIDDPSRSASSSVARLRPKPTTPDLPAASAPGKRAADQADAEDDDLSRRNIGVLAPLQRLSRASRKRAFSLSRPMVTRRCSGSRSRRSAGR
jgi:hypothetical protein